MSVTTSKSPYMTTCMHFWYMELQAAQFANHIPQPDSSPESSDIQYNFHYAGLLSLIVLKTVH